MILLIVLENAFFSWLFNEAPVAGVVAAIVLGLFRIGWILSKHETRLSRLESDVDIIKSDLHRLKEKVATIDTRLGKVEGQLDIVIDMLKDLACR